VHLSLTGLLSYLPRKNAEQVAALAEVERLVMQQCIATAPWAQRPLVKVLVGQVVERLGKPDGVIAFDLRTTIHITANGCYQPTSRYTEYSRMMRFVSRSMTTEPYSGSAR
jgi:hypothetical protein